MLTDDPYVFQLTRYLSGIGAGIGACLAGITITEMMPTQIAGKLTMGVGTMIVSGCLVSASMGFLWHNQNVSIMDQMTEHWRMVLVWPAVISIIRLIIYLVYYRAETAQFYFDKYGVCDYSIEKSKESLEKIYAEKDVPVIQRYLIYQHKESSKEQTINFCSLFTNQYRRQMFAGIMFQFFQQFSGINFLLFYSIRIFTDIGQNGTMVNFVLNIANFFASFIAMYMVDKYGRKTNFVLGILVQGFAL